jgi:hypothetical protein
MPITGSKQASPAPGPGFSLPRAESRGSAAARDGVAAPSALERNGVVVAQCEHIRISGQRCGSPALRGEKHCYFHDHVHHPLRNGCHVPIPEDAASIQIGLGHVIRCLEAMPETPKTYALMLYALQTASTNLKRVREEAAIAAESLAEAKKEEEPSLSSS